ncbi:MAG: chromosome segregation protein SMC [Haloplanus sp.]
MSNRVEELESQVAELQAAVDGLTEELVETRERLRQLEDVDNTRTPERRETESVHTEVEYADDPDPESDAAPDAAPDADTEADTEADSEAEAEDDDGSDSDGNDIIVA